MPFDYSTPKRRPRLILYVSACFIILFIFGFTLQNIGLFIPADYLREPENAWNILDGTYEWLFVSYQDFGFVRRAFIGTIFSPIPEEARYPLFVLLSLASVACLVLYIAYSLQARSTETNALLPFWFLFSLSPLGAMQIGWTFGRFEFLNYATLIICVLFILRNNLWLTSLFLSTATLTHEAFIFYGWPLAFAILYKTKIETLHLSITSRDAIITLARVFALPIALATYLLFFGNSEADALGADRSLISIQEFTLYTYGIVFIASIAMLGLQISIYRINHARIDLIAMSPWFCYVLFFFGTDYARWLGITFFILIFSISYQYVYGNFSALIKQPTSFKLTASYSILIFPFFGPIGVETPFPALESFLILSNRLLSG